VQEDPFNHKVAKFERIISWLMWDKGNVLSEIGPVTDVLDGTLFLLIKLILFNILIQHPSLSFCHIPFIV